MACRCGVQERIRMGCTRIGGGLPTRSEPDKNPRSRDISVGTCVAVLAFSDPEIVLDRYHKRDCGVQVQQQCFFFSDPFTVKVCLEYRTLRTASLYILNSCSSPQQQCHPLIFPRRGPDSGSMVIQKPAPLYRPHMHQPLPRLYVRLRLTGSRLRRLTNQISLEEVLLVIFDSSGRTVRRLLSPALRVS